MERPERPNPDADAPAHTVGESADADEPIDAVYLWVDGSDPAWRRSRAQWLAESALELDSESARTHRFRDNGELRYSLRSLDRHAPWIRRVHLVTNGQVPVWLDRSSDRIRLVPHDALFERPDDLPTFNSNAIEMNLHRIPGLSRRFLLMNDDLFFGRSTRKEAFLRADGGQRIYLDDTPLHDRTDVGPVHDRAYAHTQDAIDRAWGQTTERPPRHLPAHVPQLYDREVIAEIEGAMPEEFAKTASHRFRQADDLVLRVVYAAWMLERAGAGRAVPELFEELTPEHYFARFGASGRDNLIHLVRIARRNPRFFCINDEVGAEAGARLSLRVLPWFLRQRFPGRSGFEAKR